MCGSSSTRSCASAETSRISSAPHRFGRRSCSRSSRICARSRDRAKCPILLKELLTVRVSQLNSCAYCLASHTALSRKNGATDEQLDGLQAGQFGGFEPGWRAAFAYADAMTPTGGDVTDEIYAELARWWTPPQIIEITSVIGFFNYFNRFAEALRIPVTR